MASHHGQGDRAAKKPAKRVKRSPTKRRAGETRALIFPRRKSRTNPPNSIAADMTKQVVGDYGYGPRRAYYVDEEVRCTVCTEPFVFSAREQKFWYETLGIRLEARATRCLPCRRLRRTKRGLDIDLREAHDRVKASPKDPDALLHLAAAIVRSHQHDGSGRLSDALAAARKARRASARAIETDFWEAQCHALAGRRSRAREFYERFLSSAASKPRYRELAQQTYERLAELDPPPPNA